MDLDDNNIQIKRLNRRIECLERRLQTSNNRLENFKRKHDEINNKYKNLSTSFLGRLQLFSIRLKTKVKKILIRIIRFKENKKIADEEQLNLCETKIIEENVNEVNNIKDKTFKKKYHEKKDVQDVQAIMKESVIMDEVYVVDWKEKFFQLRSQICDLEYFKRVEKLISKIPNSNGSRYYNKLKYKIGIIADEFIYQSYKDVADFTYLSPDNYKFDIDYVIIVTAWKGLNNEWKGLGNTKNTHIRKQLFSVIDYYKSLGKKIVYYSKEDPSNYYVFLDIAKRCDYIFTTAEECIEHYRKDTNVKEINVLKFGVNPIIHNPIGIQMYDFQEVLFAGTWWNKKYPERIEDMEIVFKSILNGGRDLKLIDRNYSLGKPDYFYPEQYLKYVSPEVNHEDLQKIHKLYSWSININTIKSSNTMFAGRVYEMQALGNIIISNHSVGMEKEFPNIIIEDGNGLATDALRSFDSEETYKLRIEGIRRVMSEETVFDRISYLLAIVDNVTISLSKKVGIIIPDKSCQELIEMANQQSYQNKTIIFMDDMNEDLYNSIDFIAFFELDNRYDKFYIEDMINGFKYTDSDFITKDTYIEKDILKHGVEHNYVSNWDCRERTVFYRNSFDWNELINKNNIKLYKGYSIDHFNYCKL